MEQEDQLGSLGEFRFLPSPRPGEGVGDFFCEERMIGPVIPEQTENCAKAEVSFGIEPNSLKHVRRQVSSVPSEASRVRVDGMVVIFDDGGDAPARSNRLRRTDVDVKGTARAL